MRRNKPQGGGLNLLDAVVAMHIFSARLRRGKLEAASSQRVCCCFSFVLSSSMLSNKETARALNRWGREGLDTMGGADGAALEELVNTFYVTSPANPQECKHSSMHLS